MSSLRRFLVAPLAAALLAACSEGTKQGFDPQVPPIATSTSEGAKVPLPKQLAGVGGVKLPAAAPPSSWSAEWRLEEGASWRYEYKHKIEIGGASAAGNTQQSADLAGTMVVAATSATEADVNLKGVVGRTTFVDAATGQSHTEERPMPDHAQPGLLSLAEDAVAPKDPLLSTLLRPPPGPMSAGDVVVRKVDVPVTTSGKEMWAHGDVTWTLRGFVKCGEHSCARFDEDLAVGRLERPAGVEGDVGVEMRAIGWSLFDVDDGSLYAHQSATRMRLFADLVAPPGASEQEKVAIALGKMDMTQEHLHDITRR